MSLQEGLLAGLRAALLMAEAVTFGSLLLTALAEPAAPPRLPRVAFAALLVTGLAWVGMQSAVMAGSEDPARLWLVVRETWVGHVAVMRFAVWGVAWWLCRRGGRVLSAIAAAVAMALHAASGHAAAGDDGWLLASVVVHVLAAGAWIGSLPGLWQRLGDPAPERLVARYAWMGGACVLVLAGTAAFQARQLAGGLPGLVGTEYGRLLLVKLAGFAALIGLAWRNQFRLVQKLPAGVSALQRAVAIESALGLLVLLAASGLAGLAPAAHEQPDWPFGYRLSLDPLEDPFLAHEAWLAIALTAGAGIAWFSAIVWRRWVQAVAATLLLGLAAPHLDLLFAPAVPTQYWQSTAGHTPVSIAAGAAAYAVHCVNCHGETGHGDGKAGAGLAVPPADLAAAHLWDHTDGELFWWVGEGMRGPDGRLVMPGFADRLSPGARWAVIDFLHANNTNGPAAGGMPHHH